MKKSLEAELLSLRQRVTELEEECNLKNKEVEFATVRKEEALAAALSEIAFLKEDCSVKTSVFDYQYLCWFSLTCAETAMLSKLIFF